MLLERKTVAAEDHQNRTLVETEAAELRHETVEHRIDHLHPRRVPRLDPLEVFIIEGDGRIRSA